MVVVAAFEPAEDEHRKQITSESFFHINVASVEAQDVYIVTQRHSAFSF